MRKVVVDTNVLTAGLRSRTGASFRVLELVASRRLELIGTTALFLEYEDVLNRPEQRDVHGMSQHDVSEFLRGLAVLAVPVDIRFRWRPQLSDTKDEMVLDAAINGRADAIVTFNRRDFVGVAKRFGIGLLSPAELTKGFRQ